jgi:hypothetical protein
MRHKSDIGANEFDQLCHYPTPEACVGEQNTGNRPQHSDENHEKRRCAYLGGFGF